MNSDSFTEKYRGYMKKTGSNAKFKFDQIFLRESRQMWARNSQLRFYEIHENEFFLRWYFYFRKYENFKNFVDNRKFEKSSNQGDGCEMFGLTLALKKGFLIWGLSRWSIVILKILTKQYFALRLRFWVVSFKYFDLSSLVFLSFKFRIFEIFGIIWGLSRCGLMDKALAS